MCKLHDCYFENILSLGRLFFLFRCAAVDRLYGRWWAALQWRSCVNENHKSAITSLALVENARTQSQWPTRMLCNERKIGKWQCRIGANWAMAMEYAILYIVSSWFVATRQLHTSLATISTANWIWLCIQPSPPHNNDIPFFLRSINLQHDYIAFFSGAWKFDLSKSIIFRWGCTLKMRSAYDGHMP